MLREEIAQKLKHAWNQYKSFSESGIDNYITHLL